MLATDLSGNGPIVRCYSAHTYAQEPQSFLWEEKWHAVAAVTDVCRVLDKDSGVVVTRFTVSTESGARFILSYDENGDTWTIEPQRAVVV